jgi:hypothetical protein
MCFHQPKKGNGYISQARLCCLPSTALALLNRAVMTVSQKNQVPWQQKWTWLGNFKALEVCASLRQLRFKKMGIF